MTTTPFDILCPQHLLFDNYGVITHVGPGLRSLISPVADQFLYGSLMRGLRPTRMKRIPRHAHTKRLKRCHLVIGSQRLGAILAKTTVKGIAIRKINPPLTGPTYFLHCAFPDVLA